MGRQATPLTTPVPDVPLDAAGLNEAQQIIANAMSEYSADRDLLNQLLGQAQMADSIAKFSLTVSTSKLAYVKENKLYRALRGQKSADGQQFLEGTWDEFCQLIGRSRQQIDTDITNLRAFGEEALESMSRMGIGYRELRQYRRLDADQQIALIEVAKAGDKTAFLDIAEELINRHSQEKAAMEQKLTDQAADLDAKGEVLAGKNQKIDDLSQALHKAQRRIAEMPADEAVSQMRQEVTQCAYKAEVAVRGELAAGIDVILSGSNQADNTLFINNLIGQVEQALLELRNKYGISTDIGLVPTFLRPDAEDVVRAALKQAELENNHGTAQ